MNRGKPEKYIALAGSIQQLMQDMELKSLKKKFKDKRFAAGCSRDIIKQGAQMLDWSLDELLEQTLEAMKAVEAEIPNKEF